MKSNFKNKAKLAVIQYRWNFSLLPEMHGYFVEFLKESPTQQSTACRKFSWLYMTGKGKILMYLD